MSLHGTPYPLIPMTSFKRRRHSPNSITLAYDFNTSGGNHGNFQTCHSNSQFGVITNRRSLLCNGWRLSDGHGGWRRHHWHNHNPSFILCSACKQVPRCSIRTISTDSIFTSTGAFALEVTIECYTIQAGLHSAVYEYCLSIQHPGQ